MLVAAHDSALGALVDYLCCPTVSSGVDRIFRRCSKCPPRLPFRPKRSFRCQSRLPCDTSGQSGALVVLVAVQLSVPGLYLPPVFE